MSEWVRKYLAGEWDTSHWRFLVLNTAFNAILFVVLLKVLGVI